MFYLLLFGKLFCFDESCRKLTPFQLLFQPSKDICCVRRKSPFCISKNKAADQLCSNCTADQQLCSCSMDMTFSLLAESKISSLLASLLTVQPGLCQTWSKNLTTTLFMTRLIWITVHISNTLVNGIPRNRRLTEIAGTISARIHHEN